MNWSRRNRAAGALLGTTVLVVTAAAQEFGETVVRRTVVEGDLYLAGNTIEVAAQVNGDLVAAGQRVTVDRPVKEDVIAAGEVVTLNGPVGDDVRTAGRLVTLGAPVGDHVVAAGETVTLATGASTGGYAWLAGRLVQVFGKVGGELRAAGQELVIGGTVSGDVNLTAQRIRILDTARIQGHFAYRSPGEPKIADGAVIDGEMRRMPMPEEEKGLPGAALGTAFIFLLGLFVAGAAYLVFFPGVAAEAAATATTRLWPALGLGLAVLLGVPFVMTVLAVTVIGLVLSLVGILLYGVLLLVGYLNGVAWVARLALARTAATATPGRAYLLLAFFFALVLMLVVQVVPVLGQLAVVFVWLAGTGSLVVVLGSRYRGVSAPLSA